MLKVALTLFRLMKLQPHPIMSEYDAATEKALNCCDFEQVVEIYSEKIEEDPDNVEYLTKRCEALMNLEDFEAAKLDAEKTIKIDETFGKGFYLAAKCAQATQNLPAASRFIQKLQDFQPAYQFNFETEFPEVKTFQDLENEIDMKFDAKMYVDCLDAMRLLQQMTHISIDRLKMMTAKCHFHFGEFQESREILSEIVKDEPKNFEAMFILANCLYHEGNLTQAIYAYETLLKMHRDIAVYEQNEKVKKVLELLRCGNYYYQKKKYRKSIKNYSNALKLEQMNQKVAAAILNNRGMALKKSRFFKSAIEDFNDVFMMNSKDKSIHSKRAYPLYKIGRFLESITDCEEALKLGAPTDFEILRGKAKKKLFILSLKQSVSSRYKKFSQPSLLISDDRSVNVSNKTSSLDLYWDSINMKDKKNRVDSFSRSTEKHQGGDSSSVK